MPKILQAYGDLCILARQRVDTSPGGVAVPQKSNEGAMFLVISVGGMVPKNIRPGMMVQIVGKAGENFAPVPNFPDLIVISAQYICYRFLDGTEKEYSAWRFPEANFRPDKPPKEDAPNTNN